MTQKPREDYETEMNTITDSSKHTMEQKQQLTLALVLEVLLDIREKLFNPDMKS